MSVWPPYQDFTPAINQKPSGAHGLSLPLNERRVAMRQSQPIEVDGIFLGAAVEHELGFQFIAVDARVTEMHQSIWPTLGHTYQAARQLFKSGRAARHD